MFRATATALALAWLCAIALAATEADRRDCASHQNDDAKIAACTRIIEDKGEAAAQRTLAYRNRGNVYGSRKLHELANLDFAEALELSPQDQAALFGRARSFSMMGQYDRAIADFTQFLQLNPRGVRAFNERGLVHERKGDLDQALADFDSALRINPQYDHARNNRALALSRQGKFEAAIAEYGETIRIQPNYILAYWNRGRAYEETGQYEKALFDYKTASEMTSRPNSDEDQRGKTRSAQRLGRLTALIAEGKVTPRAMAAAERRVALIIGNGNYEHVAGLRNPGNDGKALATALRDLGFEVREAYDIDLSEFGKVLKGFGDLAAGADWAVIYFAGHGLEIGGTNYLIPTDAKLELQRHVEDEAMPLSRVLGKVTGASKMQLVILDACRNNPFVAKMRAPGSSTRSIGKGLASIEPESGMLVAYAARDGTTALDGDTNSPYLEALVKHLAEPGLEINLLFRRVRDDVLAKTGRHQEPFTYGSLPAQPFYFKR
jgi:tetratricopeptide (TPR) repeat protein